MGVFWGPWALFSAPFGCLGLPWGPVWPPKAKNMKKDAESDTTGNSADAAFLLSGGGGNGLSDVPT